MKKLLLLLLTTLSFGQTVNYTTSQEIFANPERGMYYHTSTTSTLYEPLNQSSLTSKRVNDKITLILRVFYLEGFRNSSISSTYLTAIKADFNKCRKAKVKVIVRFAYNDGDFSGDEDASKAVILKHIAQLKPILATHKDVIACIQMGFIGRYGEGYYTTYFGNSGVLSAQNIADRNEILQAIVTNFPRQIQVRTPLMKQRLLGTTAQTTLTARIGHHNDSFLSSNSEQGTYSNVTAERLYVQTESTYVVVGGEANEYPTSFTSCSNALIDLNKYSWAYFNSVGYASGLISGWSSCLDEIKRRLGYRFELISSTVVGDVIKIKIRNAGFGHLYNPRPVKLVLRSTATGTDSFINITAEPRLWLKGGEHEISATIPAGSYKLSLFMPDEFSNVPEYAVRFANLNTWNALTGYNDLQQTVNISALKVIPNPTKGNIEVFTKSRDVLVLDFKGQAVEVEVVNFAEKVEIKTENLEKGIYFLVVDKKSYKFIKE